MSKAIKSPSEIPNGPHWVILVFKTESFFIPGDERSRTNPGHGYPEHTETVNKIEMTVFLGEKEWQDACEKIVLENYNRKNYSPVVFSAFHVDKVANVTIKPKIEFSTNQK